MTKRYPTVLAALAAEQGLTYARFTERFDRTASRLKLDVSCSQRTWTRWKSGDCGPPLGDAGVVLEEMFGLSVEQLRAAPTDKPSALPHDLDDLIDMTADNAHEQATDTVALSINDVTIDQLREELFNLARRYSSLAPRQVYEDGSAALAQAQTLRDRTQVPAQMQQLSVLAGQTCALLSQSAFDLGRFDASAKLARTAALYGENARYAPLQGFSAGALAIICYFAGRYTEAVRLARSALALPGLGDTARARLASIEARALGHAGDAEGVRRSIALAEQYAGGERRDELHDEIGGEYAFGRARQTMSHATTLLLIGDSEGAEQTAQRAVELALSVPGRERSTTVIAKASADLASARLLRGEVDGAGEALLRVWEVPPQQRVTGVLTRVGEVRRRLANSPVQASPLGAQLAERAEDYMRVGELRAGSLRLALE